MKTASMIPVVIRVERVAKGRTEPSWEEVYRTSLEESDEAEYRSVCEGYPEVLVQGGYSVPGGMGM